MTFDAEGVRALAERIADYAETANSYANWSKRDCLTEAVRLTCLDARDDTLRVMGVDEETDLAGALDRITELEAALAGQRAETERMRRVADEQHAKLIAALLRAEGVGGAVAELDAEHYPDPELKGRGGCVMCWPKDGSWPCTTRQIADGLRPGAEGARLAAERGLAGEGA